MSAAIAFVAVLDLLMTERQKKVLADSSVRLWYWLDSIKAAYSRNIRRYTAENPPIIAWVFLCALMLTAIAGFLDIFPSGSSYKLAAFFCLLPVVLAPIVHFGRLNKAIPIVALAIFVAVLTLLLLEPPPTARPVTLGHWFNLIMDTLVVSNLVYVALFIVICIGMLLFFLFEAIMRFIAEHSKGPLFAASALFGAIAALIKVFA